MCVCVCFYQKIVLWLQVSFFGVIIVIDCLFCGLKNNAPGNALRYLHISIVLFSLLLLLLLLKCCCCCCSCCCLNVSFIFLAQSIWSQNCYWCADPCNRNTDLQHWFCKNACLHTCVYVCMSVCTFVKVLREIIQFSVAYSI